MHPLVFLMAWQVLGVLFAVQEYLYSRTTKWKIPLWAPLEGWAIHFLLWGLICLGLWYFLRERIYKARLLEILGVFLPLSIAVGVIEEAVFVACFHYQSMGQHLGYLLRLEHYLLAEIFDNLVIFWIVFALFRGIGYYQRFRAREYAASRLEAELVTARLQALRMQLNPHFLFNALNSVSSLMRTNIETADEMLERLANLLRITLEKGDARKIPLQQEIEIVQLYVSIQELRYGNRVTHCFNISPEAWDLLVPTMILQPIVENAYVHGVSKSLVHAMLDVTARTEMGRLIIEVRNTGAGLVLPVDKRDAGREGLKRESVGIANVKSRLQLHYGTEQDFSLQETVPGEVTARFVLPLETAPRQNGKEGQVAIYTDSYADSRR